MSRINSARRDRLSTLRNYLVARLAEARKEGNSGKGIRRWVDDLDELIGAHERKER